MVLFCAPNARSTFYSNRNTNSKWHLVRTINQLTDQPTLVRIFITHMLVAHRLCLHVSGIRVCVAVYRRWFVHKEASTFELVHFLTGLLLKMPSPSAAQIYWEIEGFKKMKKISFLKFQRNTFSFSILKMEIVKLNYFLSYN